MASERKGNELDDDMFVTSEELRLFDQLISSGLDLSDSVDPLVIPLTNHEQEELSEAETISQSASDFNADISATLFPEVDENKENNPLNSSNVAIWNQRFNAGHTENLSRSLKYADNDKPDKDVPRALTSDHDSEGSQRSTSGFNPWSCRICKRQFKHQFALNRHLSTHTNQKLLQCDTCGKTFRQLASLTQHRAIHTNVRPFVCSECPKTFNRISTLISHKKTHTDDKPHKCGICSKAFHQKGNLRNHMFTHSNLRPYKCQICGKGFNQMSNLVCHRSQYHERDVKHECERCMQTFGTRSSLYSHEKLVHGIHRSRPRNKPKYNTVEVKQELESSDTDDNVTDLELTIDSIKTDRMREVIRRELIPFALLETWNGGSFPVKLTQASGNRLNIVPATDREIALYSRCGPNNVQIKLPMVAKITQSYDDIGRFQLKVEPIHGYENLGFPDEAFEQGEDGSRLTSLN